MRGIELNFITKEGQPVDNELFLDNDKTRPNKLEIESWLKSGNTIRCNVNEYLPDGEESYSFNDCLREFVITTWEELEQVNENYYKVF